MVVDAFTERRAFDLDLHQLAARLYISRKTASLLSIVLSKLGVGNRAEAAAHAVSPEREAMMPTGAAARYLIPTTIESGPTRCCT